MTTTTEHLEAIRRRRAIASGGLLVTGALRFEDVEFIRDAPADVDFLLAWVDRAAREIESAWAGALREIALGYNPKHGMTDQQYAHEFLKLQHDCGNLPDKWWIEYEATRALLDEEVTR